MKELDLKLTVKIVYWNYGKLWKIIENKTKLINLLYKFIIIIRDYREEVRKKVKRLN